MEYEKKYHELLSDYKLLVNQIEGIKKAVCHKFYNLGHDFFNSLVKSLYLALQADYTYVGKLEGGKRIQLLSFYGNDKFLDNFSYDLKDTPCDTVVGKDICIYQDNVDQQFPKDKGLTNMGIKGYCAVPLFDSLGNPIGIIVGLFKKPITNKSAIEILLMSYAHKASSEIEHQINYQKINDINQKLAQQNIDLKKTKIAQQKLNQRIELSLKTGKQAWFEVEFPQGKILTSKDLISMLDLEVDNFETFDDFASLIHSDDKAQIVKAIHASIENISKSRFRLKNTSGIYKWFRLTGQHQNTKSPEHKKQFLGLIEDIDEQVRNEIAKEELENNYHQLISNFPNGGILLYDKNLRFKLAGGPDLKTSGFPEEKLIGKTIYEVFPDHICTQIAPAYLDSLKGKETILELEFLNEWHRSINIPNRDSSGEIIGGIVMTQNITAQKEAEEKLKISQNRYLSLLESTQVIAWELDLNTKKFSYISPQVKKLSGYSSSEWIGFDFWESILHEDDREKSVKYCLQQTKKNRDHSMEYRIISKNGQLKWINDIVYVDKQESKPKYLRGYFIDITDQKVSENKLKESEEKFRKAFNTSPDSININKLDGTFVEVSEGFTKLTGYKPEEVEGKLSSEVNIWADPKDREKLIKGLTENGFVQNLEAKFKMKNGDIIVGLMSASLIEINHEPHIISISRDISERRIIQEKLEASERKFRFTFDAINEGLWDWDLINDQGTFSQSFYELLGYEIHEVENSHDGWNKLMHKDDIGKFKNEVSRHINGETSEISVEYRLKTRKGDFKWLRAKGKIMEFTDTGAPKRILAAIADIDNIKKAEVDLELSYVKYKTLADYTYDWEYWKDPDNNFIYVSPSSKRVTGYDPEIFLQNKEHFRAIIHKDDLDIWNCHEHKSMGKKIPCKKPIEFRIYNRDGRIIWINHICQPVFDNDGNYIGNRGTNRDITDQKMIQLNLIASESKYRLLFENMTSGFALHKMVYDRNKNPIDYIFLEVNPAFEKLTGLSRSDLIGKNVREVLPQTEDYWISTYGEIAKSGKSTYYENYSKEINKHFSTYVFSPEKDRFAVIFHDITEKKQIEENLIKSEFKLKLHLEQTPLGVIEWGLNSEILSWNKAAEKIFGYSSKEIFGKLGIKELVPDYLHEEIKLIWEKTLKKGNERSTNENITKDGKIILCDWYNTTIVDDEGKLIGMISMVEDVTEREKIQSELRKSEERHKMISRIASDYVYSTQLSPEGGYHMIDWVSGGFTRMTGYTVDELNSLDENWESLIHPEDKKKNANKSEKVKLPISRTREYRIISKNGAIKWISDNYVPIQSEQGKITGYLGSITDITERKLAEDSLRKSEERLKRLSELSSEGIIIYNSGIALEVNDAFSKMTGYTKEELIGENIIEKVVHKDDLDKIDTSPTNDKARRVKGVRKDGSIFNLEYRIRPYEYNNQMVKVTSVRDITAAMSLEQDLKKNEEYLNQAQKIAHIGHWHWDITADHCYFSDELRNIYEIGTKQYKFRDLFDTFTHTDDKKRIIAFWNNISESKSKFDEEFRIRVQGKTKWLRVVAEIRFSETGSPSSALGLSYDITERKLADIKIRENDKELIELTEQIANYKMMALRSVMNPHFIFNCLNSIQFFIAKNEKKPAISYLSLFSKLMRNVLNSSVERYVSLRKELETLDYYVKLEKLRFDDNFDYVLEVDDDIDQDTVEIPSMVIQPYIENAIIHGLSNKLDTGTLLLKIVPENGGLICIVEDDGIGREASMKLQKEYNHKSYGMTVTEERLNIINKTDNVKVEIADLEQNNTPTGTRVTMKIELRKD